MFRAFIILVPQDEQSLRVRLLSDEVCTLFDPSNQVEVFPANGRRPYLLQTQVFR